MNSPASDYQHEFPVNEQCVYLNHAAVAPWPLSASKAVAEFAMENAHRGASDYPRWLTVENRLRENLATLTGADRAEIALVKNTSEALSFVAYGIDWQPGDTVLISDEEFPSNRIVWESLQNQGVIVREVSLSGDDPDAALIAAIREGARLVSISAVQYASGTRMNLNAIGAACRATDTLFCVDAIQTVGINPFDVRTCGCDFAMADGHKWLLGAEGLGFFYIRKPLINTLKLNEYGWHMVEKMGDYSTKEWQPASDARRFECGSPNILAAHALEISTTLLLKLGMEQVEDAVAANIRYLATGLTQLGAEILTPDHSLGRSGIISFRIPGQDSTELYQKLMKAGVICAARGGGVRFSPHFHTPVSVLDRGLDILKGLI